MKALTRTNIKGMILSKSGAVLALALVCLFAVHGLQAETVNVKNPQALPVVDKANVLTPAQTDDLSSRILALGKTDGTQLVVLTVPTTGDEDSFSFAQRIATEWGIGQKKNDNGVLFMVAKNDRRVQFQVGYGLEGRLTDALSKRIQTSVITPEFKKGDYYKGISQGVNAIIAVVKGEYKAPPEKQHKNKGGAFSFLILFIIIVFFARSLGRGGPGGRGGRGGNIWMTGGGSGGGWGSSGGDSGGGFGGGGFGGGGFGGGGAGSSW